MECWPDNPCNINLGHILQVVAPLFEERIYADGTFLAKQGERAKCIFFLQEGETIIYHTKNVNEGIDSDDEEEEEVRPSSPFLAHVYLQQCLLITPLSARMYHSLQCFWHCVHEQTAQGLQSIISMKSQISSHSFPASSVIYQTAVAHITDYDLVQSIWVRHVKVHVKCSLVLMEWKWFDTPLILIWYWFQDHANKEVVDKRQRLKREGSMLKTMFCATITASRLVSAVRYNISSFITHQIIGNFSAFLTSCLVDCIDLSTSNCWCTHP